jgi:hypothetical protein
LTRRASQGCLWGLSSATGQNFTHQFQPRERGAALAEYLFRPRGDLDMHSLDLERQRWEGGGARPFFHFVCGGLVGWFREWHCGWDSERVLYLDKPGPVATAPRTQRPPAGASPLHSQVQASVTYFHLPSFCPMFTQYHSDVRLFRWVQSRQPVRRSFVRDGPERQHPCPPRTPANIHPRRACSRHTHTHTPNAFGFIC